MEGLLVLAVVAVCIAFLLARQMQPLTAGGVSRLAAARRHRRIRQHYGFSANSVSVDAEFKAQMDASGGFYQINESVARFPSYAAALLKYKKHEWFIVGFERGREIDLVWLNKGEDNSSASILLGDDSLLSRCMSGGYTSVLILHNHPNPNPSRYTTLCPSPQDHVHAVGLAEQLNRIGVNVLAFVCARGDYCEFLCSPSASFFPQAGFAAEIGGINGSSWGTNFSLHMELYECSRLDESDDMASQGSHLRGGPVGGTQIDTECSTTETASVTREAPERGLEVRGPIDLNHGWQLRSIQAELDDYLMEIGETRIVGEVLMTREHCDWVAIRVTVYGESDRLLATDTIYVWHLLEQQWTPFEELMSLPGLTSGGIQDLKFAIEDFGLGDSSLGSLRPVATELHALGPLGGATVGHLGAEPSHGTPPQSSLIRARMAMDRPPVRVPLNQTSPTEIAVGWQIRNVAVHLGQIIGEFLMTDEYQWVELQVSAYALASRLLGTQSMYLWNLLRDEWSPFSDLSDFTGREDEAPAYITMRVVDVGFGDSSLGSVRQHDEDVG